MDASAGPFPNGTYLCPSAAESIPTALHAPASLGSPLYNTTPSMSSELELLAMAVFTLMSLPVVVALTATHQTIYLTVSMLNLGPTSHN